MRLLKAAHGEVIGLAFSPDGRALAAAIEGQGVFLWNLHSTGTPVVLDTTATYRARDLYFSPDGRMVGWLAWDGWKLYDRDTRQKSRRQLDARGQLFRLVASPNVGRVFSQHNFKEPALIAWERTEEGWAREWDVSTEHLSVQNVTVEPGGRYLAMLTRKTSGGKWWARPSRLELRSTISGVVRATGDYPYSENCPLTFSPDGSQIVGVHEMTLLVWSAPDLDAPPAGPPPDIGCPTLIRNDSRKHFTAAAYHPSGKYLFAASNDGAAHLFDTERWARQMRFGWDLGRLRAVAVSPDASLAAAGGDRGEVVVWDLDL